jgi:tetratricopeptide (TPR) repeat protein
MSPILRTVPVVFAVIGLTACSQGVDVDRAVDPLNVIDQTNLSDVMLNAASPDEAVAYFQRTLAEQPDRIDMKRGLAASLVRAGPRRRGAAAVGADRAGPARDQRGPHEIRRCADPQRRLGRGRGAARPDSADARNFERYRLEAMVADSNREWDRAESFYETAVGLTTRPAGVLNNWGFSRLTRGDHDGAEELFLEAISYDPNLFTAKNNLVLARAAQGNYQLPLVRMTQIERAQLLHTAALAAIRQGEISTGRNLLSEAIDTHPQHFDAAVRALRALDEDA